MVDKKKKRLSKTYWFNIISALLASIEILKDLPFIKPEHMAIMVIVVNAVNVFLRSFTFQPVTEAGARAARKERAKRAAGDL